jgi:hypothetical protein
MVERQSQRRLAQAIVGRETKSCPHPDNGDKILFIRSRLALSNPEVSRCLGTAPRFPIEDTQITAAITRRLLELYAFARIMGRKFEDGLYRDFLLREPSPAWKGKMPLREIERGNTTEMLIIADGFRTAAD